MSATGRRASRKHKLMTKEIRRQLPALYANDGIADPFDAICYLKLFVPYGAHTWYFTEFDGEDRLYGYGGSPEPEWGYSLLSELEEVTLTFGRVKVPAVERDLHFQAKSVREALAADRR